MTDWELDSAYSCHMLTGMGKKYNADGYRIYVPMWVTYGGLALLGVAAVGLGLAALLR